MLTVDMENKENGSLDVKNSVENGRPPDPADWAVTDVVNYFRTAGFEEQANAFQEQGIGLLGLQLTCPIEKRLTSLDCRFSTFPGSVNEHVEIATSLYPEQKGDTYSTYSQNNIMW
ncbi:sterile alpha motif domain-containing protein 13 isoform X3 [Lathamus discolor]|uniref:sterile alpha motif domain-containing protein 13 isoform X3 n=1 Tax=Lathamus discolor TaxID=678569 RepID=UPI0032B7B75A